MIETLSIPIGVASRPIEGYGFIYALCAPDGELRYIGQTITSLQQRNNKHISTAKFKTTHIQCWVSGLVANNQFPEIKALMYLPAEELDANEISEISRQKALGARLVNIAEGGAGMRNTPIETRDKISKTLTGRKQSAETIAKRTATLKKVWMNPKLRELKSRQTSELNAKGVIGTRGMTSTKKGKSFEEMYGRLKSDELKKGLVNALAGVVKKTFTEEEKSRIVSLYSVSKVSKKKISLLFKTSSPKIAAILKAANAEGIRKTSI